MKKLLIFFVLLAFSANLFAQKIYEGYWGNKGYDIAYSAAACNDGGYIMTGLSTSGPDPFGIVVIKTNATGDTQWTIVKGGQGIQGGNYALQTTDGGYIIAGHTENYGSQDCDAFLMKLDNNGREEWLKHYGSIYDDIAEGTVQLADGSFVFTGITASYGNPPGDSNTRHMYFVKTNSTGDMIWQKYYAGKGNEEGYSIVGMPQGGFLAAGYSSSFGDGEVDGWLLRLNDNGDTLWTRLYRNGGNSRFYKILPTNDKGYMLAGFTTPTAANSPRGLIVKLDANGKELWEKTFGDAIDTVMFRDAAQMPNGNFIFTGTSYEHDQLGMAYILATDASGNKLSGEECGGHFSTANAIAIQGNNGYLIAGGATYNCDPLGDMYYRTLNNTITGLPGQSITGAHIYPNPVANQAVTVVLPADEANQPVSVEIFTISGNLISSQDNVMAKNILLGSSTLPPGHYVYHISCKDGKVYNGKLEVE